MAQKIFSLDIRDDLIVGVVVSQAARSSTVLSCSVAVLGEKSFSEALDDVLLHVGYDGEICRVSVGAEHFFYRNLHLPFSDKRKIDKILPYEIEGNVVVDIDSLVIDSFVSKNVDGSSSVIAAMIDNEFIALLLEELGRHNIDPEIITVSGAHGALQLGRQIAEKNDFALVDLGVNKFSLFIVKGERFSLIRTISHDDGSLANYRLDKNSQMASANKPENVDTNFSEICRQIKQTLYTTPDVEIDIPIFLTGPLASLPDVKAQFTKNLSNPVEIYDVISNSIGIGLDCGVYRSDLMTGAVALGIRTGSKARELNFRKGEFASRTTLKRAKYLLPRLGVPLVIGIIAGIGYLWNDFHLKTKELDRYKEQRIQIFSETLPDVRRIEDPVRQLKVEIREIEKGMLGEVSTLPDIKMLDLMAEISVRIPASLNIHVVRLVADRRGILLRGLTDNFNSVDSLQQVLKKSPYFETVTINSANLAKKSTGVRFELKLQLNRG